MKNEKLKRSITKWSRRVIATLFICGVLLLLIVLNPLLSYANKTEHNEFAVFHNKPLTTGFSSSLDAATALIRKSELYTVGFKIDICLNDGSYYPSIIKKIKGDAFAFGFYNKVVLAGKEDSLTGTMELNGYRWNLDQLLAHEIMHCFQYKNLGFWDSNPVAGIAEWKWEGYPEYIARQNADQSDLKKNIDKLIETEKTEHNGWISFPDGSGTVITYYKNWLLVQYCFNIRKMNWKQLLDEHIKEELINKEMMNWYQNQK